LAADETTNVSAAAAMTFDDRVGGHQIPDQHHRARTNLLERLDFELDEFQLRALDALGAGANVVVAAPTGSGKTIVAEYAVEFAITTAQRVFYTTPIKALSNQKFNDLSRIYGTEMVGLLTGDHSIRPHAPVVVMTTEVLRNMIYSDSRQLDDLCAVVLDEVHFLQDPYRGPVWEEIIIHLDHAVRLVCLSATVSNADELGEWVATIRGATEVVIETERPVALDQYLLHHDRAEDRAVLTPIAQLTSSLSGQRRDSDGERRSAGSRGNDRWAAPRRLELVEALRSRSMLPAIVFIFSRNGCDEAADGCRRAGLVLTTASERTRIDTIVTERLAHLDPSDLAILGAPRLRDRLLSGIAAHHAGMVPTFKEIVEACFVEGLIKVVFATETLAVGINMPARSVVIERLSRFTGQQHQPLSPGEYTQLTGRAGRRGIDSVGSAIVAWNRFVNPDQLRRLANSRSFRLRSVFSPTFNMAVNLISNYGEDRARQLLGMSFAQFQAERTIVETEVQLRRAERRRQELAPQATSPYGDLDQYRRRATSDGRGAIEGALNGLRPGDVIEMRLGRQRTSAVVVTTGHRKRGIQVSAVTPDAQQIEVRAADLDEVPPVIGRVRLPATHAPKSRDYRRQVAARLRRTRLRRDAPARGSRRPAHPVERDPDLKRRLRAARHLDRLDAEISELVEQRSRHRGLIEQFDAILDLLDERGYVDRRAWTLTTEGVLLASIFHELDLLIAETVRSGLLDGIGPAEIAYLVSCFVYEHRGYDEETTDWYPSSDIAGRVAQISAISVELESAQLRRGLQPQRAPDPTFGPLAHAWVAGESLAEVVADDEMSAGDFVRTIKQLIDVLRQLAAAAPDPETRRQCAEAARRAARDVITESSMASGTESTL